MSKFFTTFSLLEGGFWNTDVRVKRGCTPHMRVGNISEKASFLYNIPASHVEMSATSLFTRTCTDLTILFEDGDFTAVAPLFACCNIG